MFNVVTSLARFNNVPKLLEHLKPKGVTWHVIMDEDSINRPQFDETWIKTYICPNSGVEFYQRCHYALSWFLETQNLKENEYYSFMNDDDGYEPDFFRKVKRAVKNHGKKTNSDPKVIIVDMMRGHNIPADAGPLRRHGTSTLMAHPGNIGPGGVGMEQIIAKGGVVKNYRFPLTVEGDGHFITNVVRDNQTLFVNGVYALFNYFEPGRWNK